MNNFDITYAVKCHIVPEDKLRQTEITFLDFKYDGVTESVNNNIFQTIGPKVFIKKLSGETMKTSLLTHTDELVKEILNSYYDMSSENEKDISYPKLEFDIKNNNTRELVAKCMMAGNMIAQQSRIGMGNVVILPDDTYKELIENTPSLLKVMINPTTLYKDKIFVLRVNTDTTTPGLSLFTSRSLVAERYVKLIKIMKRLGRNIDDLGFSYILTKVGLSPEKLVRVIHLTNK